jgi:hypothetical protein
MHADYSDTTTLERESRSTRSREGVDPGRFPRRTWFAICARVARMFVLVLLVISVMAAMIDRVNAWRTERLLSGAARAAAEAAISTPLNANNCGATPCPIESAAAAAKRYLVSAGFGQASCINPMSPSFSGVLVWVFSCDSTAPAGESTRSCHTNGSAVCIKVDLTSVVIERNGTLVPYARAIVQYPQNWLMSAILRPLPRKLAPQLPGSVAGSARVRNST